MDHCEGEAQRKYTAEEVARRAKGLYEQAPTGANLAVMSGTHGGT